MKNIYNAILVISVILLGISCANIIKKPRPGDQADKRTLAEYELDDLDLLVGDEGVITSDVPEGRESPELEQLPETPERSPERIENQDLFSAQVYATKSSSEAKEFKDSIDPLFEEEIHIEYQAPYYKVCVGTARSFDSGQDLLQKVSAMGFPKAWLVKIKN